VYYPDGMKLEIKLTPDIVLVETIRVVVPAVGADGSVPHAEHMFELGTVSASDYHRVRLHAFQQCLARVPGKKVTPPHRAVIFGVSHQSIQDGIQQRTTCQLKKKKQVRWGDHVQKVDEGKVYGGWGLEKVFEIPNRYQLKSFMVVDQEDDDFELEDDLEILSPDEDIADEEETSTMDAPEQELVDESAESDDDEEEELKEEVVSGNKRQRKFSEDDDEIPASPPPVTLENDMCSQLAPANLEDEIKQFDMWLLQNDVVI
jgi:hypothetical protein